MTLPAPNLDDRRFQDLVDDAKRLIQLRCPEWTDHNVSDPGVTLIETFAMVVDQLLYRLNRVPDRLYVRYLDLLGVRLFPPTAAKVDVTLWLSARRDETVTVKAETEVSTVRTESQDAVVFATVRDLEILPCSLARIATTTTGGQLVERTEQLASREPFPSFSVQPTHGDALLLGLSRPVPSCAVALRFTCDVEGVGVDPTQPPLRWEAWQGQAWVPCEKDRDDTGGLNRPGDVVLHIPPEHVASVIGGNRAGWLRCRVVPPEPGQPFYSASPRIEDVEAFTIGGTVEALHAERVGGETVGLSEGVSGQRFALARRPVVAIGEPLVVEVAGGGGWDEWREVEHFANSIEQDRHFVIDRIAGEIVFGPGVRLPDGSVKQHGAVPPKGAPIRMRVYHTGGGRRGNVARSSITALRGSIPYVARVENRGPAAGGIDGEDLANAVIRGPLELRTRQRAVTGDDYEYLARAAAPEVARVRCVTSEDGQEPGVVRVLLVPDVEDDEGDRFDFEDLKPDEDLLRRVAEYLDERRIIGTRLVVEPPYYRGVTVVARIRGRRRADPERLRSEALIALYRYLHPLRGGPSGHGWSFGRPVQAGELFAVLQALDGADLVEEIRLYPADPVSGQRGDHTSRIDLDRNALVFSYEHHVRVTLP